MTTHADRPAKRRVFFGQNVYWIAPLFVLVAVGVFFAVGYLVPWLWRVTVSDIFGFKPISFWQAWGLILLSQILFKANVSRSGRGGMRRRGLDRAAAAAGTEGRAPHA